MLDGFWLSSCSLKTGSSFLNSFASALGLSPKAGITKIGSEHHFIQIIINIVIIILISCFRYYTPPPEGYGIQFFTLFCL
jgi:hypothetical protein